MTKQDFHDGLRDTREVLKWAQAAIREGRWDDAARWLENGGAKAINLGLDAGAIASTQRALPAPKSVPLPVSASSVEARQGQDLGDGHSPSSGGGL